MEDKIIIDGLNATSKLMQEISERIKAQFQGEIEKVSQVMVDAQYSIAKELANYNEQLQRTFEQLQQSFNELPENIKEALLVFGKHGWYLDEEMSLPDIWNLKKELSKENIEKAEQTLIEHFERRLDDIEKFISKKFPQRKHLIKAAFNAHRRSEYELAIPVLFSQIDGICKDVRNRHLFIFKDRKSIYVNQIIFNAMEAAMLSLFSENLPIWLSVGRPDIFDELNRHMVLHGESLDYGTKTNSLKAISLINYVSHVLKE